ncbi:hypothetical protein Barb7_02013 [Bacteroidales bacterium Barb7]|nr:hypothetical protein Barb7_02013 [Bacteroidales bacterium Barb7]
MCQIDGGIPIESLAAEDVNVEQEFKPVVGHIAHVCLNTVIDVGRGRHFIGIKHIGGLLAVPFEGTAYATVEKGEVQTHVEHGGRFPFQIGVGVLRHFEGGQEIAVVVIRSRSLIQFKRFVRLQTVLITGYAVAGTQFQIVQPAYFFHKAFLRNAPCGRYGGEGTPFVVSPELGRAVAAHGSRYHILLIISVVGTGEEGNQFVFVLCRGDVSYLERVSCLNAVGTHRAYGKVGGFGLLVLVQVVFP